MPSLPSQTENLSECPHESMFGDKPLWGWSGACGRPIWERENPYGELVAGLIADEFLMLREAVDDETLPR